MRFYRDLKPLHASSETQGQIVGPKTKIKTGGKKFDEQKYERKIRAPGDKLFRHQFQTAERILAPDWAENYGYLELEVEISNPQFYAH